MPAKLANQDGCGWPLKKVKLLVWCPPALCWFCAVEDNNWSQQTRGVLSKLFRIVYLLYLAYIGSMDSTERIVQISEIVNKRSVLARASLHPFPLHIFEYTASHFS